MSSAVVTKRKRPGPVNKIGPVEMKQAYACLALGCSLRDVAAELEVDYATLYRERKRNPQFARGVRKAIQKGKRHHLNKIRKATQWQASAWFLERVHGKQFGRKDVTEVRQKRTVKHEHRHTIDYDQLAEDLLRFAGGRLPADRGGESLHPDRADEATADLPRLAGA